MPIPDFLIAVAAIMAGALVLLLPLELWQRYRNGALTWASIKEMGASAGVLLPVLATDGVVLAFIAILFGAADAAIPWRIPTTVWTAIACVLLVDLLYYWDHRTAHRVRLIWAIAHSVHHSSNQYDQTTGLRVSFVDGFISPWFYLPAVLIGFDPVLVGAAFALILGYQQWLHTETIGKLGWIDRVFNTPSNHRVHHGAQAKYLDRNYGAILILWDRLFGTWQPEEEAPRYGLVHPIGSSHLWTVHVAEAKALWAALAATPQWQGKARLLLGPPDGAN